jgi:hypothetical protein
MSLGGVIYIGDRETGKTHLAMELTNQKYKKNVAVTSLDYNTLQQNLYDKTKQGTRATGDENSVYPEYVEVEVNLTKGIKTIKSQWLDTPGEIWRPRWQKAYPDKWQKFLDTIHETEGILLILPPYREIINPSLCNDPDRCKPDDFPTRKQWMERFDRWIDFFSTDCPQIRHLLLCMNKADLLINTNLKKESEKLAYKPYNQQKNWQEKHEYVYLRYFGAFQSQIDELNRRIDGLSVRCFITSVHNRDLLELPWIYLGSHLGK